MKRVELGDVLSIVHSVLQRRYGELTFVSGQGIAKGQRVEFDDKGSRVRCVIKTSAGGRISFGRRGDGTWSGLSESDRIVVVGPTELEGEDLTISMFGQNVLMDAFEANHAAQTTAGVGHVPSWIAPFHEEGRGPRGVGDGFGKKALWSEPMPGVLADGPVASSSLPAPAADQAGRLTLQEAKVGLARTFGVSPDAIEITIKG